MYASLPTLPFVQRASQRAAAVAYQDLKGGVDTLRTFATVAPLVGFLGATLGIAGSFPSACGECYDSDVLADIALHVSNAISFAALGLLMGLTALMFHRLLSAELVALRREMEDATFDLLQHLRSLPQPVQPTHTAAPPLFERTFPVDPRPEQPFLRRAQLTTAAALAIGLETDFFRYFLFRSLPATEAAEAAAIRVAWLFALWCLALYPIWVKFFRSRRGAHLALSSLLTAAWTLMNFAQRYFR